MNLVLAIAESFASMKKDVYGVSELEPEVGEYWLDALLVDLGSYDAAVNKILQPRHMPKRSPLLDLIKSLEVEGDQILKLSRDVVRANQIRISRRKLILVRQQLEMHLKRQQIKSAYLTSHLRDYFSSDDLSQLGQDFVHERDTLVARSRSMEIGE
jgi:hypothetical protein